MGKEIKPVAGDVTPPISKEKASSNHNPEDKVSVPESIPPKLPEDYPLLTKLKNVVSRFPSKEKKEAIKQEELEEFLSLLKYLKTDDSCIVTETYRHLDRLLKLKVDIEDIGKALNESFSKSVDEKEKNIIFSILLIIDNSTLRGFIPEILENGEEDNRFNDCVKFLKSLDEPDLENFIYRVNPYNHQKMSNLADVLLTLTDKSKVLSIITKRTDDLFSANEVNIDLLTVKQQLLVEVMGKMIGDITVKDLLDCYIFVSSWTVIDKIYDLFAKHFKTEASEYLRKLAYYSTDKTNVTPFIRTVAVTHYARLEGANAVEKLKEVAYSTDDPETKFRVCDSLVSYCGQEGTNAVEELIDTDIANDNPSLTLASVITASIETRSFDEILKRIFSKDIDLKKVFINLHNSQLKIAIRKKDSNNLIKVTPEMPCLIACIGFEKRLADWILYSGDTTLARNAKKILYSALELDKKSFLAKTIKNYLYQGDETAKAFQKWIDFS